MKKIKNKGFTLFEALLSISVLGTISTGIILNEISDQKKEERERFIKEANDIIQAVDHRIAIDGYDPDLWGQTSWNNEKEIVDSLIKKELTSKYNKTCSGGTWEPTSTAEKETKLIDCNLWENRKKNNEELKAELEVDSVGFIQRFNLFISFKDVKNFTEDFKNIKYALNTVDLTNDQELAGSHYMGLVSKTTGEDISTYTCISDPVRCSIKVSFERSGGNEYIRADGANSMIGTNLSFIESKGNAPLKCTRWSNTSVNGTGTWTRNEDEECGIGIYPETGEPVVVEVAANRGTFKHIVLDKSCKDYEWNGTTVIETGTTSPCGTTTEGTEIYQVIPNVIAKKTTSLNIYSDNIFADSVSANIVNTLDRLKTDMIESYSGAKIDVYSQMTIKDILRAENDAYISGNTYIGGNNIVTGIIQAQGDIISDSRLVSTEELVIKKVNTEGSSCSINGSLSRLNDGSLLSCASGKWESTIKDTTPIGTVVLWASGNIPSGWIEMNGQSTISYPELRAIVGNYVPDMRGNFARGWDHGAGRDSGRTLKSYQQDQIQNITGSIYTTDVVNVAVGGTLSGTGAFYDVGGSAHDDVDGAPNAGWGNRNVRFDASRVVRAGNETRPKNIALIYIIKAK